MWIVVRVLVSLFRSVSSGSDRLCPSVADLRRAIIRDSPIDLASGTDYLIYVNCVAKELSSRSPFKLSSFLNSGIFVAHAFCTGVV